MSHLIYVSPLASFFQPSSVFFRVLSTSVHSSLVEGKSSLFLFGGGAWGTVGVENLHQQKKE